MKKLYLKKAGLVFFDSILIFCAIYSAYLIRFDFNIWHIYERQLIGLLPTLILTQITSLYFFGGYRFIWRYTSLNDLVKVIKAIGVGVVLLAWVDYLRNFSLAFLFALAFSFSALFYHSFLRLFPSAHSRRKIVLGALLASVVFLGIGILAFTVVSSAPVSIIELPLGDYLVSQDFQDDLGMPRSVLILDGILCFLFIGGARIAPRLMAEFFFSKKMRGRKVLIYGAGDVGENLARILKKHTGLGYDIVGFVDDEPSKQRASLHGVRVLGTGRELADLVDRYDIQELLLASSGLSGMNLRAIVDSCWNKGITVKKVPPLGKIVGIGLGIEHLEEVNIENLLGRAEVQLDAARVVASLQDKVVIVTGAGGSIGSELCRQISRCRPARLLLLGKGENSIYHIQKELSAAHSKQETICLIGDIGDHEKMEFLFRTYRPEVVFHAAAYKHVPFMEDDPEEAVTNNVFGTRNIALVALRYQAEKFILISSDKAVQPSSVMGTTKKIAELILQQLSRKGKTQFITVRFGNVLRSRGSVIPFFEKQIDAGGPVTVTHPDMQRYFMSIPEAVRLVLHSGAIGNSGSLCILDMGKPVRIVELAENMITLAGKRPYKDIDIVFTGIRPGEKLSEELFTEEEVRSLRKVDKIQIGRLEGCDWEQFDEQLERLQKAATQCQRDEVRELLKEIVPSYEPCAGITEAPDLVQ
jgi:FlaA1/EpsC-like NDP-sugar epimerase